MGKEETILVFEPLRGGHRAAFIGHLLDHLARQPRLRATYLFAVDEEMVRACGDSRIRFVGLPSDASERMHGRFGGFAAWRVLRRLLDEWKPDRVVLMDLTWLELPLCFLRMPCPFSGILFVQYPELQACDPMGWRRRLKFFAKELKTRLFLRNAAPRRVHLLNGAFSCAYLNRRFGTSVYRPLPDPVSEAAPEAGFDLRRHYGIGAGRRVFLLFGSMSARKGVEELAKAIHALDGAVARRCAFLFCGRPERGYAARYRRLLGALAAERPGVALHIDESHASDARMRALFEQADWILLPYTRPEYSSGILAQAAVAGTPVIGTAEGLVGRQIGEYGLGVAASPDAASLAGAIARAADGGFTIDEARRAAFVRASDPERFAGILLEEA